MPFYKRPVLHDSNPEKTDHPSTSRIALINSEGTIVAVNKAWMSFAKEMDAPLNRIEPGMNYLELCRRAMDTAAISRRLVNGIQSVLNETAASFTLDYSCRTASGIVPFRIWVKPIIYGHDQAAIIYIDAADINSELVHVTELRRLTGDKFKRLQQFTRRLIKAQEEERQKIAREMHDDLGHKIALMSFSVRETMQQHAKNPAIKNELNRILEGIHGFSESLRNLSHSLHPPSLRYLGIRDALKSLCKEFEETCKIRIELVVPPEAPRLTADVELCVFRIVQEALQNIAKHSRAKSARVLLEQDDDEMRLTVFDRGCGFDPSEVTKNPGLGLLSMEERALSIGALLAIHTSAGNGTDIHLCVPIAEYADVPYA